MPKREGWGRLAVSFTGYLMCASLLATAVAKADNAFELGVDWPLLVLLWTLLSDAFVFLGLGGLFALAEGRWSRGIWFTAPLAVVVAIYVALNTAYLIMAGEQGSWQAIVTLKKQFKDVEMVLEEALSPAVVVAVLGTVCVLTAVPIGLRRLARRPRDDPRSQRYGKLRAGAALPTAGLAGLVLVALPAPRSVDIRVLGENCVTKFLRSAVRVLDRGKFEGYPVGDLVADAEVERFRSEERHPNILLVVLESTRYDHTSISGEGARAHTPRLGALARGAFVAHTARAVVPHTTKSLFSMLCARYPTMQRGVIEVSSNNDYQCLPEVLAKAGYRTAFFQSAFGTFEQRPRLAQEMGFDYFEAWEDIRGRKLGYLASADGSLFRPFSDWLLGAPDEPFFATILTSATHHSYRLTPEHRQRAQREGLPMQASADRYARLVEAEDDLLGRVLDLLDSEGITERTIIVVVGDHGEGFGAHGVKQHDNNFYEEGLRVPFVIAGPGVPARDRYENVSLIDLTPTLLSLLRLRVPEHIRPTIPGYDVTASKFDGDALPRYFACYSSWKCRGFVLGDHKLVYSPESDEAWYFDLESDPDEREPLVVERHLEQLMPGLHELVRDHRSKGWTAKYRELDTFGDWWCPRGRGRCLHPRAESEKYRYSREDRGD